MHQQSQYLTNVFYSHVSGTQMVPIPYTTGPQYPNHHGMVYGGHNQKQEGWKETNKHQDGWYGGSGHRGIGYDSNDQKHGGWKEMNKHQDGWYGGSGDHGLGYDSNDPSKFSHVGKAFPCAVPSNRYGVYQDRVVPSKVLSNGYGAPSTWGSDQPYLRRVSDSGVLGFETYEQGLVSGLGHYNIGLDSAHCHWLVDHLPSPPTSIWEVGGSKLANGQYGGHKLYLCPALRNSRPPPNFQQRTIALAQPPPCPCSALVQQLPCSTPRRLSTTPHCCLAVPMTASRSCNHTSCSHPRTSSLILQAVPPVCPRQSPSRRQPQAVPCCRQSSSSSGSHPLA
ncbi:hypothetical protein Acr_13g0014470 [Actinidia rufa]|uniref:Uncharacterized protein n=1 Tax=Actinidia rufa TaxID=165716 RepID=A0A7J0FQ45_9ERIC|nr:hypothetical protein Acr_13g0014470 [Actinidia rufa]